MCEVVRVIYGKYDTSNKFEKLVWSYKYKIEMPTYDVTLL